jgi:hypothetical protein
MTIETLTMDQLQTLDVILDGLMRRYRERVPDVDGIIKAMIAEGVISSAAAIENDHIAFRTMGVPHLGIASLEKVFLHCGYEKRDQYYFPEKKITAYWYHPPKPHYPRIFISELHVWELSEEAQRIIHSYTDEVTSDPVDALNLYNGFAVDGFLHQALWRVPTWEDYQRLLQESEFAAWVIYNRYYLNHFTVTVHNLPAGYNTVADFNAFLERKGFRLNDAGGKVKVSKDGLLLQSSTVAEMVDAYFDDGNGGMVTKRISGSYVEFAERRVLPEYANLSVAELARAHRREGFEVGNADKIFESTYTSQTNKRDQ